MHAYTIFEINSVNFWNFVFVAILQICWICCVINYTGNKYWNSFVVFQKESSVVQVSIDYVLIMNIIVV